MQDNQKEFSILVDRSFGGSSIVDGQIELLLHRYVFVFHVVNLIMVYPFIC